MTATPPPVPERPGFGARGRGVRLVSIHPSRREYDRLTLRESDVDPDPIRQFSKWFEEAITIGVIEPHSMALATSTPDGRPSVRIVLLRGCDERGFVFFTNYESRKAIELEANPRAALVLHWHELERAGQD